MTTTRQHHNSSPYARSPYILERRRALFPTEELDMESELGHISPLCSDSQSESEEEANHGIAKYDITGIVENKTLVGCETPVSIKSCSATMSPLMLSPCSIDTPQKLSPSHFLKTPHDTSTKVRNTLQKEQKIILEESKSLKRKNLPNESPTQDDNNVKLDSKSSKVRTALFPAGDCALSTKSFYSKNQENVLEKFSNKRVKHIYKPVKFNTAKHSNKSSRKFGQINNGVGHKIRKPTQKKVSQALVAKAVQKMLENGPALQEYIQDLSELRKNQNIEKKLINTPTQELDEFLNDIHNIQNNDLVPKKQISVPIKQKEENKENIKVRKRSESPENNQPSPENTKTRKFFKSSRGRINIKNVITDSNKSNTMSKEEFRNPPEINRFTLPKSKPEECTKKVILDSNELFEEDEMEPSSDISNILSALSDSPQKDSKHIPESINNELNAINIYSFKNINVQESNKDCLGIGAVESSSQVVFKDQQNKILLHAHNSVTASENSIQLHQTNVANKILSPISQMCNVTSGLALNSPKKGRNLTALLSGNSDVSKSMNFNSSPSLDMDQQKKLFPIFNGSHHQGAQSSKAEKSDKGEVKKTPKKFKGLSDSQMLLDVGQKRFGFTLCHECNTVYHMGDPGDEIQHTNYHNSIHILRFAGWKNEHIMADFHKEGRIIRVLPTDSKIWLRKVKDLMDVVKRDLGSYEIEYDISGSQVYLYIKNRTIAGCIVAAVPKEGGHRMLSTLKNVAMCSEESYPIKCGISHIWVATNFRKQGIGSALLDTVKRSFLSGFILGNDDIALTSPTEAGAAFAEKYFKSPNYLIYYR